MRKILFFVFLLVICFSCEESTDLQIHKEKVEIGGKDFFINYPLISTDINAVKNYLNKEEISYKETSNTNFTIIEASTKKDDKDLIDRVVFTFHMKGNTVVFFNVSFFYNRELKETDKSILMTALSNAYK